MLRPEQMQDEGQKIVEGVSLSCETIDMPYQVGEGYGDGPIKASELIF